MRSNEHMFVIISVSSGLMNGLSTKSDQRPYAEILLVARSRKSFYGLIVTLEVA